MQQPKHVLRSHWLEEERPTQPLQERRFIFLTPYGQSAQPPYAWPFIDRDLPRLRDRATSVGGGVVARAYLLGTSPDARATTSTFYGVRWPV